MTGVHNGDEAVRPSDDNAPFSALAFKVMADPFGKLTFIRMYSGVLQKGSYILNSTKDKKERISRLIVLKADDREEVDELRAGDLGAVLGLKNTTTGDTLCVDSDPIILESLYIPEPVISVAVEPKTKGDMEKLSKALQSLSEEDPTFRVSSDAETGETIIAGMGELHLEVYIERMKREYNALVETSPPRVAYRETITKRMDFDYTHKKQTGGSGQYGCVRGFMEPLDEGDYEFVDMIKGGVIPREYIPSCDKGFKSMLEKGRLVEAPVVGVRCTINDGKFHAVDSSDVAFQEAARGAWRRPTTRLSVILDAS